MTIIEPDGAGATAERFAELSRHRARKGGVRRAQLAAWAADVHTLEALLWQNGLGEAPDPHAQLAGVGSAVAASIEALTGTVSGGLSARGVVELAREAMVTTFDESVHGLLNDRFTDLGHLDDAVPTAEGESTPEPAIDRLEGRSPAELVAELRTAAADCMAVAQLLAAEGERDAARRLARQSDNAALEAYLVSAAMDGGDQRLTTVDLRWELAAGAEGDLVPGEDDLLARRELFTSLLGPAEREVLHGMLEPAPEW
jgi:hypothetical protein